MENIKISVVIPAKNEASTIGEVIREAKKYAFEVLVIDGNSTDDTKIISEQHGARVIQDSGKGKGSAVRLGIEQAQGAVIVFIDADGSHEPRDIPRLLEPLLSGETDMVIASRSLGGSDELQGDTDKFCRLIAGATINLLINWRWKQKLTDCVNGFRAARAEVLRSLLLKEKTFTIEHEMVIKALKKGYRIKDVASHEYARKHGNSGIVMSKIWLRFAYSFIKNYF